MQKSTRGPKKRSAKSLVFLPEFKSIVQKDRTKYKRKSKFKEVYYGEQS